MHNCLFVFQWSSINELFKLSSLEDLKFRFNPLSSEFANEEDVYYLMVAKIGKLKFYNRSKVRSRTVIFIHARECNHMYVV